MKITPLFFFLFSASRMSAITPTQAPFDVHEPVAGTVQVPATPGERAAVLYLLERAKQESLTHNLGMPPFHFSGIFSAGARLMLKDVM